MMLYFWFEALHRPVHSSVPLWQCPSILHGKMAEPQMEAS